MTKDEILYRIEEIKKEVGKNNCDIIRKKANERVFQVFKPNRLRFAGKLIQKLRRRVAAEIAHVLEVELDKQKEINLRLLKEIEELKKMLPSQPPQPQSQPTTHNIENNR
jgi:hypothetical protein